VVNINTERVVRRTVRDPIDDFYTQFFGYNRFRPREIRQTLQSLGSGFIIDPAGYIVTNQHVVERAADLKISVTTNDGKTYRAHYIAGDDKTDLAFIKIDAQTDFPFINLDNISPNLLGETVMVVGNAVGFLFALVVFTISVISFPLLLDRDVGAADAVLTSVRAVAANPVTMAVWGLIVAGLLVIGSLPLFFGLAIVMPVLGHATWHLYRRVVEP
jgi:S1-C subfamily serine protease